MKRIDKKIRDLLLEKHPEWAKPDWRCYSHMHAWIWSSKFSYHCGVCGQKPKDDRYVKMNRKGTAWINRKIRDPEYTEWGVVTTHGTVA